MKTSSKIVAASAATLLSLSMASAFAASSTTMNVTGKVTSGSCSTDSSLLDINLGNITPIETPSFPGALQLGYSTAQLNVTCSSPTAIAIKTTDDGSNDKPTVSLPFTYSKNAFGSLGPDNYYGLADKSTGKNIGAYTIAFAYVTVDGGLVAGGGNYPLAVSADGKTWAKGQNFPSVGYRVSNAKPYLMPSDGGTTPAIISGTTFRFPINFAATAVKDRLPSNLQNVAVGGSATFEIIYL